MFKIRQHKTKITINVNVIFSFPYFETLPFIFFKVADICFRLFE